MREDAVQHGAVSEPVAVEMAIGDLKAARADYAVSLVVSPGWMAAVKRSLLGTVWFALATALWRRHYPAGTLQR
ncbi:CinA family protein [Shigella flexneri]